MAKGTGLGDLLFIRGYDLSGDVGSIGSISTPSTILDVTGINSSGHERIHSHTDGALTFNAFFNDATDQAHLTLRAKNSNNDTVVCWFHGSTIGNVAAGMNAKQTDFNYSRNADGGLEATIPCVANDFGLEYCRELTAGKRTDTVATNGASLDGAAASTLGLSAWLHVFAFTGTSVTVAIQESSDDGGADPFAAVTGGAFTAATGITSQRIVTSLSQSVERYLRVVTTGTFSNAIFAVCATRFPYDA